MNENEFKPVVRAIFKQLGFQPRDLSPEGTLTPDFEVCGKRDMYTVELKIKGDNPEEIAEEVEALSHGGVVGRSIPIGPRNTLAGLIRVGVRQILAHDPRGDGFRVIWLHSAGQDPELHYSRFYATLFGTEKLFSLNRSGDMTCFYFHESAFHSWRDYLDGAMLTYLNKAQLCINTLSPRVGVFRKSELVSSMSKGLCDPDRLEGFAKDVMIADCPFDRKRPKDILQYLRNKYWLGHLQDIPMKKHTARILVDSKESKGNS